jgi:thiol-disulfide isomerase/thioredoxin
VHKHHTAVLAVVAALAGCEPNAREEAASARRPIVVGERVPELTVRTLDGEGARIAAGEPVTLLHVWATWCGPCRLEFRELEAIQREFGPRGLRIVAVSIDDGDDDNMVGIFAREWGATFPIGRDPHRFLGQLYQRTGVPESYLISADGRLVARQFGALPGGAAAMRAAIERALRNASQPPPAREVRRASA